MTIKVIFRSTNLEAANERLEVPVVDVEEELAHPQTLRKVTILAISQNRGQNNDAQSIKVSKTRRTPLLSIVNQSFISGRDEQERARIQTRQARVR